MRELVANPGGPLLESPPKRRRPWTARRVVVFGLLVAYAIVAATALLPAVTHFGWSPLDHHECIPGPPLVTVQLWTPLVMVNAPYGGSASVTVHESAVASWSTVAVNGSASGLFVLRNWSISASVRVLVAGPGANEDCPAFVAVPGFYNNYYATVLLPLNTTSDVAEPTKVTLDSPEGPAGSVWFDNGYFPLADLDVSTCSVGPSLLTAESAHIRVQVPFTWNGANRTVPATLDYHANYTYRFPGNFGTWSVDDLNVGVGAPGGGFAFVFTPCS